MSRKGPAKEVAEALKACVACGACMGVCPVYQVERKEELSARAKLGVLEGCVEGGLDAFSGVGDMLSGCLLCGRCQVNCPNSAPSCDGIRAGRELAARAGALPWAKRLALENALPDQTMLDRFARAGRVARPLARPLAKAAADMSTGLGLRTGGLRMAGSMPGLRKRPFLSDTPQEIPGPKHGPRIVFFVGCVTNYMRPGLAEKAIELLSAIGTVLIPHNQACCGLPALAAGLGRTAMELAQANLAALEQTRPDLVVTVCGSCAHTMAQEMERQVGGQAARDMGRKIREISQVLADHPDMIDLLDHNSGPVAVHDPCHLKVGMGVSEEPRFALERAGAQLVEMNGADQCCGGGGLFSVNRPELSRAVFEPRAEAFKASKAQVLATSCSGCFLQWQQGLDKGTKVIHPIELLGRSV